MKKNKGFLIFAALLFALSCQEKETIPAGEKENKKPLFSKLSSTHTGITFINEVVDKDDFNVFKYRNFYDGGGVAIGDINNDGLPDLFFTANMNKNRLYLNKGNFKFEDITESAGVGGRKPWDTGVLMVDVNGDGYLDIYVSNAGNDEGDNHDNDLYINNGDLTFTERAKEYNLARSGFSMHASFFDYDKDGDLDAYLLSNSNVPVSSLGNSGDRSKNAADWENVPKRFRGLGHILLRNDNGKFRDVTKEAGIYSSLMAFGLGVLVSDVNNDTYPDIYITNDFYERDYLYLNKKNGTFSEEIEKWTSHLSWSAMGVDIADVNNDGLVDIFVTDMLPETEERTKAVMEFDTYDVFELKQSRGFYQQYVQNTLQINNGNNTFSETAYFSGVARTDWSWSALLFDMDNDGNRDIFVTNGIVHDLTNIDFIDFLANEVIQGISRSHDGSKTTSIINKMPITPLSNYAFKNNGNLKFGNLTQDWGLDTPGFSNGCAYGDLDGDGDLDLVVNNINAEAFVYRNESRQMLENNYIQFEFKGGKGNTFAIGTSVKLFIGKDILVQELMPSRGFQSSMDYTMTIGLGKQNKIDSVRVTWPDNRLTMLRNVAVNQKLTLLQTEAAKYKAVPGGPEEIISPLFTIVDKSQLEKHQEDLFDDFNQERLVVKQLSKEGPALAVGDINQDGNEDFFVGGAKGQAGQIYLHEGGGVLKLFPSPCFKDDADFEDTAAAFFDADGDGDLDLAVGTGGNIVTDKGSYITRLYLNNGKGGFVRSKENLPFTKSNVSVITPQDFDQDGDADLFVGARSVPGVYGVNPQHLLIINNGNGTFTDGTERYAYDLKDAGMVTDAKWVDVDGDKKYDLVTIAEWGTPMILKNSGRRLSKWNCSLDSLNGMWKVLEASDLDGDGDQDFIFGNSGTNTPYVATNENPLKLWINDFDENGTIEQIMTIHQSDGDYPIHMRKEVTAQLPSLKKQNLKASDYSKRKVQELFKPEVMKSTLVRTVTLSESIIAVNESNGKFSIKSLPARVQWSCVCGISCTDVNGDGFMDLVMGGNNFDYKPQFSRQDASFGNVLLGNGKLDFAWKNYSESGFFIRSQTRHLQSFSDKNGRKYMFAAINGEKPKVFKYNIQQ